ncbi:MULTISPECIES: hypothetical protein [unclassified Sedimentibacter]|nr:hypothetical protein [Sedimentibacter sp. MB35-C1]WMJ76501.1 hypothetical protein RBQ61_12800 [Sedimentibacter sp. MB35-C1]
MKKKIFLLVIVLLIGLSAIYFGNSIENRSLKTIPESAVLL